MGIFINWQTTLECALIAVVFACFLSVTSFKTLGILQGFGYKGAKLFGWAGRKNNLTQARFSLLALASALASAVISLCFGFAGAHWAAVIGLSAYLIFFVLYAVADSRRAVKNSATLTPRFKRLFVTVWLVFAVLSYLAATLLNFGESVWGVRLFATLKYSALAILPLLIIPLVCLANLITLIWEAPINCSYVKKAKRAVAAADIMIVGITGSYGKTGAKNILAAMLGKKFRVLKTPSSFNTPLGIARTVNGSDLKDFDVLIAEMGARHKGDIAELCAICPPDYSLITGICPQHLESFKTPENIVAAKGEIIAGTKDSCFIAADCFDLFKDIDGEKVAVTCVSDIKADCTGTEFTLTLGGEERRVKTKLLGGHSANNIGLCAQAAYRMGVGIDEICAAVEELGFTEHRLQLIESGGVNILDDGYNSNVVGARAAITVLKYFGGKKIAVTPGLVELGILEESENTALGGELVGLDFVILVGETLVTAVKNGYLEAGGDPEKLTVVPSLAAAQDKLKDVLEKGDCVLFLNDLPEIYN
ncbi:MAG: UDP-N-acetylmuramoyl-tripeptide--D-alanyl-D-alanine ligase [Clostridiales bacterium]|nr:UDP-N-acetylmuramoyl-tripeptide--D-alanyl-D-alanine ligase [Clostridiales bacterium]